jgi:hypothetical protein
VLEHLVHRLEPVNRRTLEAPRDQVERSILVRNDYRLLRELENRLGGLRPIMQQPFPIQDSISLRLVGQVVLIVTARQRG